MPHEAAFHLGLHSLPKYAFGLKCTNVYFSTGPRRDERFKKLRFMIHVSPHKSITHSLSFSITQALIRNITHLPIFRIYKASDNHKTKLNGRSGIQ